MQHSTPVRGHSPTTTLHDPSMDVDLDLSLGMPPSDSKEKTAFFTPNQPQRTSRLFDLPPPVKEDGLTQDQIIAALRTMIHAQQEIAIQFDIDLEARDEAVEILTARLERAKQERNEWRQEAERRATAHKRLKNKVQDLEALCRSLEDDVERSREESFERSIMDAASGSAMQHLHQTLHELESARAQLDAQARDTEIRLARETERAQQLERENEALRTAEQSLRQDLVKARDAEVQLDGRVRELEAELESHAEAETSMQQVELLRSQVEAAREREMEGLSGYEHLMQRVRELQQASVDVKDKLRDRQADWDEERLLIQQDAKDRIGKLTAEVETLRSKADSLQLTLESKESELAHLHEELEAQWQHAEETSDRITTLRRDNHDYQEMIQDLEEQRLHLEEDKARLEQRLQEQDAELHELMEGRSEYGREVEAERRNAEDLTRLLEQRQRELDEVTQHRQQAEEKVAQLQELLADCDADVEDRTHHIDALEEEADSLRDRLARTQSELERANEQHRRAVADAQQAHRQLDDIQKRKAEDDLTADALQTSVDTLKDEIASLKRQVHSLQQKDADKDLDMTWLEKERDHATEMWQNLNIALEAKQQELELMKRQQGVRGTGGMTPAPSTATVTRTTSRTSLVGNKRESALFTPLPSSRPASSASMASSTAAKPTLGERKPSISSTASIRRTVSGSASATESGSASSVRKPSLGRTASDLAASVSSTARKPSLSSSTMRKASVGSDTEFKKPAPLVGSNRQSISGAATASKHSRMLSTESIASTHAPRSSMAGSTSTSALTARLAQSRVPRTSPPPSAAKSRMSPPTTARRVSAMNMPSMSASITSPPRAEAKEKENKRPTPVPA